MTKTNNDRCQTRCVDVIHEWCGIEMKDQNHMGDILILLNLFILLIGLFQHWVDYDLLREYTFILIFFVCVRAMMAFVTTCRTDSNQTVKAWSTRENNDIWFMISGHTLVALVITGFIVHSDYMDVLKFVSVLICVVVCFFQTATREHYTSDIILTITLVLLAMKSFIRCKG